MYKQKHISDSRSAFTLIEIMVAALITIIMIGLVIQITSEVLKVWNRSVGKLSANAETRIAMELLTSDLETALLINNDQQWLRSEKSTGGPGGKNTVALRLFAPALDRNVEEAGNICAIAYQLENRDPVTALEAQGDPDDRLWILYRLLIKPKLTFDDLMGDSAQNQLPDKDETTWAGGETSQSIVGQNGSNFLAQNIVEFDIDFYVEDDGDPDTPTLVPGDTIYGGPRDDPDNPNDATVGVGAGNAAETYYQRPLAYAEISLTSISDEGASLLQVVDKVKRTGESDAEARARIILEHGEVFKRRVHFQAKPL